MFRDTGETRIDQIALIGNPNSGKSTLFNALTGLRQKVANYPGVTVEKIEGRIRLGDGSDVLVIDLPGTYSLTPTAPDERIATDILLGRIDHAPLPDAVIVVVDACNLERNLYLVSQIIDCGIPLLIALNMIDVAKQEGISINVEELSSRIGVKIIPTVSTKGGGIPEMKQAIAAGIEKPKSMQRWELAEPLKSECYELRDLLLQHHGMTEPQAFLESLQLLSSPTAMNRPGYLYASEILSHVRQDHQRLEAMGIDALSTIVEARYDWIDRVCRGVVVRERRSGLSISDKIDGVLTHRVWGFAAFLGLMALMFQTIFTWATLPMEWIGHSFSSLGQLVSSIMPPGDLRDLIVNGAIGGVGAVVSFLPQILFLFFYIGILEDTGYMARAAFIMDRIMNKVGLHGKSFIPMLSSFACAIPGIMSTRTIENRKDRLVTILVAPLIGCSARLPVYTLMIAAFIPQKSVLGILSLAGLTMVSMYLLGVAVALASAWLFKRTLLKSDTPTFIMELPPYRRPNMKSVLVQMWNRSLHFLERAGTIILGGSIILWFLATYPKNSQLSPSDQLQQSFAGQLGHAIEPAIRPLGFDWKIGLGLIGSLLQREMFVGTMGTIYGIKDAHEATTSGTLIEQLQKDVDPRTGRKVFTPLTAICLMVFYVLAMQCFSTVVITKRETNSWKWPLFQVGYMTVLAYTLTFIVYRVGSLL
jgi:ferrous iron transport protein B